ncbi:MAG TPA: hypothetical protein VJ739_05060 [Gemmataceae bacterium]|nr:hypothetical protein [Gemmataceae bacterium]
MGFLGLALLLPPAPGRAGDPPRTVLKTEHFDRDPGWEGFNNRVVLRHVPTVTQDFGYSPTNVAGKEKGEIGGRVQRTGRPAYYADKIAVKTLNDKLSASGTFALTASSGNSGVFFGWFNAEQPGGGGRPMNSLGLDFDGEKGGARLAVRMIAGTNRACGTFVTPFLPGKFRPTPIRADGTRYSWTLNYDPEANGGNGRFQFTLEGHGTKAEELDAKHLPADLPERYKKEALSHFPNVTTFAVNVPPEVRKAGATFDHFGLMNLMKAGSALTIYFDDLRCDGKMQDFAQDPGWEGSGNRATYPERQQAGAQDYGFSAATHFAGGKPGEVGGTLWRGGPYSYYADRVGPLTLDDRLEAGGRVVLQAGAPDSDVFLGWFNSTNKDRPPTRAGNFLGIHVGGPTRVGHYFQPALTTAEGTRAQAAAGPVLTPGKVYDWSLVYDPAAGHGNGAITVTLGKESVTLALRKGLEAQSGSFDRFGLFTPTLGGQAVRMYLDDLNYTAARR